MKNETEKTAAQSELFYNRLVKRYKHLKKWARRSSTDAFRVYDRDIPEIPLALDFYGGEVSLALYKRPYEKDEGEEERWLLAMKDAAAAALEIPASGIFIRERRKMKGRREAGLQYGKMQRRNFYRDVHEGDLVFRVNLSDYLDTGLFLDARKKRAALRASSAGKRVLNLFAYTCSVSAAAAKGGAFRVDSVDLSNTYLEWGKVNFALNGLEARPMEGYAGGGAAFIRRDALEFLAEAAGKNIRWDIIILDPPSFSNSKKMRGTLDIKRDHKKLAMDCLSLLNPGGKLWFSSSAKGFTLDGGDFPGFDIKDMGPILEDEDFKGKKTPLCYMFKKI